MTLPILIKESKSSLFSKTNSKIFHKLSPKNPKFKNNPISHSTDWLKITEQDKISVLQKMKSFPTDQNHQIL